jgi:hypothetical protein
VRSPSLVILQVHVLDRVPPGDAEGHPPVLGDGQRPLAIPVPGQPMRPGIRRRPQFFRGLYRREVGKHAAQPVHQIARQALGVSRLGETLQRLMADAVDIHEGLLAGCVSSVN